MALRTPLYPIISLFGALMVVATFLTWASIEPIEGVEAGAASVTGLDTSGWGAAAIVIGIAIFALGILGFVWNPFSDPEAVFIALFGLAAVVGSLVKIADTASLLTGAEVFDFFDPSTSAGIGLWLVLVAGLASVLGAVWILVSRPAAQTRLVS